MIRDSQKNKAYRWENSFCFRGELIPVSALQPLVDYIWKEEGLQYPPKIIVKHKNKTTCIAHANRFEVAADEKGITTNILLHELAHSMTAHYEGKSAMHGPRWLGVYIKLLSKYSRMDRIALEMSALKAGLSFNHDGPII